MKIAQVVSLDQSVPPISQNGLEFVVSWITEELVRRGHEVTLFASGDSKTKAKLMPLFPLSVQNDKKLLWEQPLPGIWNAVFAASMSEKFDIIHDHSGRMKFAMPFVATPVLETLHGPFHEGLREKIVEAPETNIGFIGKQHEKIHFVTISKNQQSFYKTAEPHYFKKYSNIYNGIPVERFEFNNKPKDYLLFLGYINKNKGADIAVRVAQKTGKKLILAGNNYGEEKFFEEHIKPHLNDQIQYVGPVNFEQKNDLYKNAIAKLSPLYWHEPFGLTLVESQACGTPVIAFNKGAASEIIKHGQTGFIVETEVEMIEALRKIDSIDRKKCRTWVEENFSVSKMVDEYEKLYSELTHSHGSRKSHLRRLFLR